MIVEIIYPDDTRYAVAYNNDNPRIIHTSEVTFENQFTTPLPFVETFNTIEERDARVLELENEIQL